MTQGSQSDTPFVLSLSKDGLRAMSFVARPSTSLRTNGRKLAGAVGAICLIASQATAQRPTCIPHHDMRTLIRLALPDAVEALAERCKPTLPADAFLPNEGVGLANRYRAEAPVDPASARQAIQEATGQNLSSFASDDTITNLARQFVGQQIEDHVPLRDCEKIDSMVELAGNLRADGIAEAILLALEVAGPGRVKGLAVCPPKGEGAEP